MTDYRRVRSEKTRAALIAACAAVLRQGRVPPASEVAHIAGVCERTVFWHFKTTGGLHSAALAALLSPESKLQETCDIVSCDTI